MTLQQELFTYLFQTKLSSWTPLSAPLHDYFNDEEIALLHRSSRRFQNSRRTIVLLSYENRYATLGGLAAVIRQFPGVLAAAGEKVLLLTPFHRNCTSVRKAVASGKLLKRFSGHTISVCNFHGAAGCYEEAGSEVPSFHIDVSGRFTAGDNPYAYKNEEDLLFDALAFCAAVPAVLERLGYTDDLLFHAHDWETAPVAIFARYSVISSILQQVTTVLTLHNLFDAYLPLHLKKLFFGKDVPGDTVLQSMLPLLSGPLLTVSMPYAHELRYDPLQYQVFSDHLQKHFSMNPPIGIEHGMFGKPRIPYTQRECHAAQTGDLTPLLNKKRAWRLAAGSILSKYTDTRCIGTFDESALLDPSVPLFFMSGRLDLTQKGFDSAFHAFIRLAPGSALLFFTPTLHNNNEELSFFNGIAERCRGRIVIWPFHIPSARYRSILKGASFLLMPSFYEPFGAASEGFLNGTPLVARATGGLLAQIQPGSDFSVPEIYRTLLPSDGSRQRNGILYREAAPGQEDGDSWRRLLKLPPVRRMESTLYGAIVDAAADAFQRAIECFNDRDVYGSMVCHSLHWLQNSTWDQVCGKYQAVYDTAAARGI